jgi:hypothetical protein
VADVLRDHEADGGEREGDPRAGQEGRQLN